MGSFYTNLTLLGTSTATVVEWLKRTNRRTFVVSDNRATVVFDAAAESQDGSNAAVAQAMSSQLHCAAVAVTVHDDDILFLDVFEGGSHIDSYNSSPGYFTWAGHGEPPRPDGGNASELVRICGTGGSGDVDRILRAWYDFEHDRHRALLSELGLPLIAHGTGY